MKKILLLLLAATAVFVAEAQESKKCCVKNSEAKCCDKSDSESVCPLLNLESKSGKYTLSVGGNVHMKAGYDFKGSIHNPDFITSLIPVPGSYNTDKRFFLDATTSNIVIKATAATKRVDNVELCLNVDFRGGTMGSYIPRIKMLYVAFDGLLIGRNYTTFCDMASAPRTIDFEGPVVCPFIYSNQIRYVKSFYEDKLVLGSAIEYDGHHEVSLVYNDYQGGIDDSFGYPNGPQQLFDRQEHFVPDVIGYVESNWGSSSHIRLSGVYTSTPLYNLVTEENVTLNGWAAQLSGSLGICDALTLLYSGTAGDGITKYMQDTYGMNLDATVGYNKVPEENITFQYGWQAALSAQVSEKTSISAGYSAVNIEGSSYRFAPDDYRKGEFAFANVFYNVSPRIQLAAEYIWGRRTNNDGNSNRANRFYTMVQYSF